MDLEGEREWASMSVLKNIKAQVYTMYALR